VAGIAFVGPGAASQAETPLPWLHIAYEVGREAHGLGYRRVGVLGTRFTMSGPVYPEALSALVIETMVPEPEDFETVDRIIFTELVDGVFTDASREAYNGVLGRLRQRGCEAVALACTEIPLLMRPEESPLPTLDSTRLLAAAALREAWLEFSRLGVPPHEVSRPHPGRGHPSSAGASLALG
jgi:aspartate racemase